MDITVSQEQGRVPVTILYLKGRLDSASYEQLQARAREAFDAGARNLVLDLSGVDYMSSAGLRALHSIFFMFRGDSPEESDKEMEKGIAAGTFKSPHLKLVNPSKRVLEALDMAGYDMFLDIRHDQKEAIASF